MSNAAEAKNDFGPLSMTPTDPAECDALIVLLHGLGDRGDGSWLSTMKHQYQMPRSSKKVCVLLPTARKMFVRVFGSTTNAWFDVPGSGMVRDVTEEAEYEDIKESTEYVLGITQDVMSRFNLKWNQVIFTGFSQGAAMALFTGLTAPGTPAGIVSMSGFLPGQTYLKEHADKVNKNTPILFIHGEMDRIARMARPLHAIDYLKSVCGVQNIQLKTHPTLQHSMNDEMFQVFFKFLDETIMSAGKSFSTAPDL